MKINTKRAVQTGEEGESMIRSMTGYSSHREQIGEAAVSLEIKSLNHKQFDFHYHGSRALTMLEIPIREAVQKYIRRGRIEIFFRTSKPLFATEAVRPNFEMAQQYFDAATSLSNRLAIPLTLSLADLMTLNGVLDSQENESDPEEGWNLVKNLVELTLKDLLVMKNDEGQRLKNELLSQLEKLATFNQNIRALRETVIQENRNKMLERISEWKETLTLDENRILQEVAFYCDRSDVQEETVRLNSHIEQFRQIVMENVKDDAYTAIGRRLDFLCQEMFREVNTIGSKSNSIEIVRFVLEMKGVIEQIREQVQNVE